MGAVTLIGISKSEPYSGLFSGEKLFTVALLASLIGGGYLYFFGQKEPRKLN